MLLLRSFYIFLLFSIVTPSWISKEDKVCDPKGSNAIAFTGFRINRQFTMDGIIPKVMNFITISHCNKGKVDYEKHMRVNSDSEVIWNRPFCMIKESDESDFVFVPDNNSKQKDNAITNGTTKSYGKWKEKFTASKNEKKKYWKDFLKQYLDAKLDFLTEGKSVRYTGKLSEKEFKESKNQTVNTALKNISKDLVCFKMARRKKYAKNNISYYMPNSFVGALFECPITETKKNEILERISAHKLLNVFDFDCDESVSRPIFPLVAEDSSKYWIEKKILSLNPSLSQKIPYLSSASPLNLRFSINETPDISRDTWAKHIDVNENYDFNNFELNYVSKAITLTANYLNKILLPNVLYRILSNQRGVIRADELENPNLDEEDYFVNKIKKYTLNERLDLLFLSFSDRTEKLNILQKLHAIWDFPIDK